MSELDALLELDSAGGDLEPDQPAAESEGRSALTDEPRAPADVFESPKGYRARMARIALPLIAEGQEINILAARLGVAENTLRGWCMAFDEESYRQAMAGQISARLAHYAAQLEEATRAAQDAVEMTRNRETVIIEDGMKGQRYQLLGPELAKAADAQSKAAERASKVWQWLAERRRPDLFKPPGSGDDGARSGIKATFTFILPPPIDRGARAGRVLEGEARKKEAEPAPAAQSAAESEA